MLQFNFHEFYLWFFISFSFVFGNGKCMIMILQTKENKIETKDKISPQQKSQTKF